MQFQVLISFFFAYMAAVKAAPIQLPTEGAIEVPGVPALPNVPRAVPIDVVLNLVVDQLPPSKRIVDESSIPTLPQGLPVFPRAAPSFDNQLMTDVINSIKSAGITDALPNADDVPGALKAAEGVPPVPLSLPPTAKRDVADGVPPLPFGIALRQLDTTEPSLPSVPGADDLLKRQVDVPEVPNAGDIPLPTRPSIPTKLPVRAIEEESTALDQALHAALPNINLPPTLVGDLSRRQVDLPSTPKVEDITPPTIPNVPAQLPARDVGDVAPLPQVEVPKLPADATKLVDTAAAVEGLTIRQIPEVPEVPAIPSTNDVPAVEGSLPAAL